MSKAIFPRTAALFILFYQLRLFAADLVDTPFFIAALGGAFLSAVFLFRKKINGQTVRPVQAVIILAMVPWVIRLLIALPRWFFPGVSDTAILLDSLLLSFDRNNFAAILPFYWVAFTSYFSMRSRLFLRADIIAADTFFLVLFSIAPSSSIEAYRWPVLMIGLFALIVFLQILSLVLSTPPELKLRRGEGALAGTFLFLIIVLGGVFFIRPFQERAVERGGGLLEPKLFRFDFSQVLRLESEISVNDDLVMIVKKDPEDGHTLLRRSTLSGYGPKQGFYRIETDEAAHPQRLPSQRTQLPFEEIENYHVTDQEYYIVNFESSAFIGMNMPVEVIPFETWDASSFNSAYAVKSHTSDAMPFELINSVHGDPEKLGLSAEEYALYTEYGGDEALESYAREIIRDLSPIFNAGNDPSYWEKVQMIYYRLKYGEYRYSLKPGIAPDGDQLKYFLFTAKKGYCSYYAFAFTLMLRSMGIPSRVAAGFFVDPVSETFNYYPVRSNMAHAWTEVWFPGYGWIEYDPTTESLAEGEEFNFSQGTSPELFERLMREILENRSRLKAKEGEEAEAGKTGLSAIGRRTLKLITRNGPFLAVVFLFVLFMAMRSGFLWLSLLCKNPRKKALCLWKHVKRRLALAGFSRIITGSRHAAAEAEWAKNFDDYFGNFLTPVIYPLYLDKAAAAFAPVYSVDDSRKMAEHYRAFSCGYRKWVPLRRRILTWLLPPLALVLTQSKNGHGTDKPDAPDKSGVGTLGVFLILGFLFTLYGAQAQSGSQTSDQYYENAMAAQNAENWERAIELFNEGSKNDPFDFRFPWSLGNLYYDRNLYHLAWDEYRRAEGIIPWEPNLLMRLANTAGYLNMNASSAGYLEQLLVYEPDNISAIGNLSWMYFKLHRLPEGERLLLDAMERLGLDADFSMTLATIYSGMFNYQDAKDYYMVAINSAEQAGDRFFAALAYYNLSILESRFYRYNLAYDCTIASLESMNRASGKLARGELYLCRMELPRALSEYQEANSMDSSPLSKLNLAEVYQTGGRLAEAALYANDCLKSKNNSWMLNYGIDPVRYKRDIHEILMNSYEGLYKAEGFSSPGSFRELLQSVFRKISSRFYFEVHAHLFRKYSFISANAYRVLPNDAVFVSADNTRIEALIHYFEAFKAYPQRALAYIRQARAFEEPIIPGSTPSYDFEEACLLKNRKIIEQTLSEFDPVWEKDMIALAYAKLALSGNKIEKQDAAERVFAINRGALLQCGIRLPVNLQFDGVSPIRFLKKAVKAAGLEPVSRDDCRYTLRFSLNEEGDVLCELYDGGRGTVVFSSSALMPQKTSFLSSLPYRAGFARALRDGVFNAF